MGFAKIKGKLTSRIGCSVSFSAPGDVNKAGGKALNGKIVDEVWVDPSINDLRPRQPNGPEDWGDYSFCSQLIQWGDGTYYIRLVYFRRRVGEDHWEYGSQATVGGEWQTIKALCEKTLAMQHWFTDNYRVVDGGGQNQ